jgi:hypothetical protein
MERYRNLSGKSGVVAYELRDGGIEVEFATGARYLYTEASAGKPAIATMRRLAKSGRGLSTYISQTVREGYAERRR